MLWQHLKKKQILGFDFDRQKPLDNFIVDFYCKELMLAIEIDGESHCGKEEYDNYRDRKLNELGVEILRFDEMLVIHKMDKVVKDIEDKVKQLAEFKE